MAEKRNLCAQVPIDLFNRVGAERDKAGLTNSEYVTQLLTEYFMMKENGGANMAKNNNKERTLAFQISEDLFDRIKEYLDRETARTGQRLTQKDFVIGLIEAALAAAEQEAAASGETDETANNATDEAADETAQGEDVERREEQRNDGGEPNPATEETRQEAPCEDGVPSEDGEASQQPTENG